MESDQISQVAQVTYIESDIDCIQCLAEVQSALIDLPAVDAVEVDLSAGCLVVTHHGARSDKLAEVITAHGHRIDLGANGEAVMGAVEISPGPFCRYGHDRPDHSEGVS